MSTPKKKVLPLSLFHQLTDQSPLGIFIWKLSENKAMNECVSVFVNSRALELLKISKAKILNQPLEKAFPKLSQTKFPIAYQRLLKTNQPQQIAMFAYEDGNIAQGFFRVELKWLNKDSVAVFFEEISGQVEAQKQLAEKVKELERLNEFMVGREIKMMELKKENARLKKGRK